jgi:hypothetical protein
MGVDGIGGAGPSGPPDAPGKPGASEGSFSLEASAESREPTDLDRVASGDLSVEGYLDARVDRATRHLQGAVGPEVLKSLQQELREQLSSDPVLQRLVQRTLGASASEPSR